MNEGIIVDNKNGQIKIFLNEVDITHTVIDMSIYTKNGMFVAKLDIPLSKCFINQDIKTT